ncbi:hypothetical protein [Bradyrhizobium yuanmingense]|uniref:hypothetical protein n=1 Tax=Bradyrhizobium yuanmingense TaxID=108015 RepID=UPI00351583CC
MAEAHELNAISIMTEAPDFMSVRLNLRSNFAFNHLRAAIRAAQSALEVECANDITQHGAWFEDMMMHVPVAVVMASAALDANCNEIVQDILDGSPAAQLMQEANNLKGARSGKTIERYRTVARLLGKTPQEGPAWQNAGRLVSFRNAFMHFKPAWDTETNIHDDVWVMELRARLPISPGYQSNFMFPYGLMTYGCAKWAVEAARTFSAEFSLLVGVKDGLAGGEALS